VEKKIAIVYTITAVNCGSQAQFMEPHSNYSCLITSYSYFALLMCVILLFAVSQRKKRKIPDNNCVN